MNRVFLIRHGKSEANDGKATTLPEAIQLIQEGHIQAQQIAAYLQVTAPPELIVSSRYLRSKQTAEPTRKLFPLARYAEWDIEEFTYLSSRYLGHSTPDERRPLVDAYWEQHQPFFRDDESSESFEDFVARAWRFIAQLQAVVDAYENIAIFSHEQFINAVLWLLEGNGTKIDAKAMACYRDFFLRHHIPNGAFLEVKARQARATWNYELRTEHLRHSLPEFTPLSV